jgi:hypothetical protein
MRVLKILLPFLVLAVPSALPADAPASDLAEKLEPYRLRETRQATFREFREHPIRRSPSLRYGTATFERGKGLVLAYEDLRGGSLAFTQSAIRYEDSGGTPRELTAFAGADLAPAVYHLLHFDGEGASDYFDLALIEDEGVGFVLDAVPLEAKDLPNFRRLRILGEGGALTEIRFEWPGGRSLRIELNEQAPVARE